MDDDEVGGRPLRGVVEVEWDGWEHDRPRSKAGWIVGTLLVVAVAAVAGLTWWALGADADLDDGLGGAAVDEPRASATTLAGGEPDGDATLDALRAALPGDLEGCVPPPDQPEGPAPDGTVRLECPRPSAPSLVTFTLFPDDAARDQAFDDTVAVLELDAPASGDCALGAGAVHEYVGAGGRGEVACRRADDRVDLAWTDAGAPVLGVAGGLGSYAEQYGFWSELVDRTDASFPLPVEQALLDQLPGELTTRCDRDQLLAEDAGGSLAVTCLPATGEATEVSWIRFAGADPMTAWIEAEQLALSGAVTDTTELACRPGGRGPSGELPAPWVGATPYRQGTSTGTVLCHVDEEGRSAIAWTRAGVAIGSIAVSDGSVGDVSMADLAAWWEAGGHLP